MDAVSAAPARRSRRHLLGRAPATYTPDLSLTDVPGARPGAPLRIAMLNGRNDLTELLRKHGGK